MMPLLLQKYFHQNSYLPTTTTLQMLLLLPLPIISSTFWVWEFVGRLHPMIVHFPIVLLILALGMEAVQLSRKNNDLQAGISLVLPLGIGTAILATILGLILHKQEAYNHELVENHERLGILTTLLAIVSGVCYQRWRKIGKQIYRRAFQLMLLVSVLTLTLAGHNGASLTHGADYLSSTFPSSQADEAADIQQDLLAEFAAYQTSDSLTISQLDRLNLEVRAIFAHHCYQCHSEEKSKGELMLDSKESVFAGGESGPIIEVGKANQSELMRRIRLSKGDDDVMPSKGKLLTKSQIDLIQLWINTGAHWADQALKTFPEAELALKMPDLPVSRLAHPIDKIVDAYFKEQQIEWKPVVSDRIFLRRVHLDLTGLLPTPEVVSAFERNTQADKRTALIDSLLADNHAYTQQWLSFWNDLLRNDYSGTGYITGGRKSITQWLYASLLTNKPYDQMVRELLDPSPDSEGFIKGIRWRGVVNSSQSTQMQAAQNISQSLLGLNLKCASCHNSFVSNLTLDQAYGFASIFADTILEIHRCDKPTGRMAQTKFIYPELGEVNADSIKERLEQLAKVVVQPANGRLYRTMVNRLWDRLLGRGIIMPVDEMDLPAWNQDLLDWLAADMIEHSYDLKHVLRTILTSHTYQLPSVGYRSRLALAGEDYVFRGPVRRRMSAEQLADALGQSIAPLYRSVAFDPVGKRYEAEWIWHREIEVDRDILPKPGKRYFRHRFQLPATAVNQAEVLITANHSFVLWINGERIGSGNNWKRPMTWDISQHLQPNGNVIAVEGENEGVIPNPAGLLVSLNLHFANGKHMMVSSSRKWKTHADTPDASWTSLAYDDSAWEKAKRFGGWYNKDWGRLIEFQHSEDGKHLQQARASLVRLDPFLKALGRPTRENVTTRRSDEATLLQALTLTNGAFFNQALAEGAETLLQQFPNQADALVQAVYQRTLSRQASVREVEKAREFLGNQPQTEQIQDLLWAVVLLPEFQLIY
ncbi:MAG: DUF1549 domain-containing protein [Bacteroidota bacterium]